MIYISSTGWDSVTGDFNVLFYIEITRFSALLLYAMSNILDKNLRLYSLYVILPSH